MDARVHVQAQFLLPVVREVPPPPMGVVGGERAEGRGLSVILREPIRIETRGRGISIPLDGPGRGTAPPPRASGLCL